jgi:hypothetical protein
VDKLLQLKLSWPGSPWSWDGRFAMVASSFTSDLEPRARASAMLAFPRGWTTTSFAAAPASLQAIVERTGGLRAGQRLLAGGDDALYGLWWPWANGTTITLRIGFAALAAESATVLQLRALFEV